MSRLHVAIGAVAGTTGGPATYAIRLAAALARRDDLRVTVLTDAPERFAAAGTAVLHVPMRGGLDRLRWQYFAMSRAVRRLAPDVYHDTKNAMPFGVRAARVVTVHDLAYYTVPETFPWASRTFLRTATTHAVRRAACVVVPSQATADDVASVYRTPSSRLVVAPHGIDAFARPGDAALREARVRLGLPERFVLHVGTLQSRKNVDLVVAGVRKLRERGESLRVVVVGRLGWHAERTLAELRRDDTALWLPHLSAADLAACYALAEAFVSPSAYEGFGLAVADALAAGLPTVIADVSSLPELCGDAAVRLPRLDADAVAATLATLLGDLPRLAELRRRAVDRAARFSWAASAARHAEAYHLARRSD